MTMLIANAMEGVIIRSQAFKQVEIVVDQPREAVTAVHLLLMLVVTGGTPHIITMHAMVSQGKGDV